MSENTKRQGLARLLSCRPARLYSNMGVETLGALVELTSKGFSQPSGYGKLCYTETADLLLAADILIDSNGNIDEEQLCKAVSRPFVDDVALRTSNEVENSRWIQFPILRYTREELELLSKPTQSQALHNLHLNSRAATAMLGLGVDTVGGFVDKIKHGINANLMSNFGRTAFNEIAAAIIALSSSIDAQGECDWLAYAASRRFKVLPSEPVSLPREAVEQLSEAAEQAIRAQFEGDEYFTRFLDIFNERLHCSIGSRLTLEELGSRHSVTREKIRQDEGQITQCLCEPMLMGRYSVPVPRSRGVINYHGLRFRLRPEMEGAITSAKEAVLATGRKVWPLEGWIRFLAEFWDADPKLVGRNTLLISRLFGFSLESQPIDEGATVDLLFAEELSTVLKHDCRELLKDVRRSMQGCEMELPTEKILAPLEAESVLNALNLSSDEFLLLSQSFDKVQSGAWKIKPELFKPRIGKLTCDVVYQILSENRNRMHNTQLLRIFKLRRPGLLESDRLLTVRMSYDSRFKPVGRSGYWVLTEWELETGTLRQVIERILEEAGGRLQFDDICREVRLRGPWKVGSVRSYLTLSPEIFVKLGVNIYGLAAKYPNRLRHDDA